MTYFVRIVHQAYFYVKAFFQNQIPFLVCFLTSRFLGVFRVDKGKDTKRVHRTAARLLRPGRSTGAPRSALFYNIKLDKNMIYPIGA
jgi:hypothetical protein